MPISKCFFHLLNILQSLFFSSPFDYSTIISHTLLFVLFSHVLASLAFLMLYATFYHVLLLLHNRFATWDVCPIFASNISNQVDLEFTNVFNILSRRLSCIRFGLDWHLPLTNFPCWGWPTRTALTATKQHKNNPKDLWRQLFSAIISDFVFLSISAISFYPLLSNVLLPKCWVKCALEET